MRYLITLLLIFSLTVPCLAGRLADHNPLYEDPSGWQLWTVKSGVELLDWYYTGKSRASSAGIDVEFPAFEYMACSDWEAFCAFPVIIPDQVLLVWNKNSAIIMTYIFNGEKYIAKSQELFIQRVTGKEVAVITTDQTAILMPRSDWSYFATSKGDPIIFAKFLLSKVPDKVINCSVENVITKQRR